MQPEDSRTSTLRNAWGALVDWIGHMNNHAMRACALHWWILTKLACALKLLSNRTSRLSPQISSTSYDGNHVDTLQGPEESNVHLATLTNFTSQPYSVSRTESVAPSPPALSDLSHAHTPSQPLSEGDAVIPTHEEAEGDRDRHASVESSGSYDTAFEHHSLETNTTWKTHDRMTAQYTPEQFHRLSLRPLLSTEVERYSRQISIAKRDKDKAIIIKPMTLRFEREQLEPGWVRCTHPEGALYYYNEKKRVYTEAYLDDRSVLEEIEKCITALFDSQETLKQQNIINKSDLVLEFRPNSSKPYSYYFANHESRTLFWLDEQNMQDHLQEVHGELTESHMKYAMERFYWLHMSLFPHNHRLTSETVVEVKALLTWALTDQLTSLTSPTQYTAAQLTELISLVDKVKDILTDDRATATVGRILADFAWSQFLNYHGEYGARLNSNQSVHNHDPPRRSSLMSAIFLTLFNAPITHWDWIKDIYTDDIVRTLTWKEHLNKLKDDWQECILCSTVLLNANVAFLAVPHLIPDDMTSSTTGQVASYLSLLTSAGSVIIGLLLQRQHRIHSMGDAWDAHQYLTHYMKCVGSTEMLAVVYSLPYGLLMWAMIAFLVAIAFECFNTQNIPTIAMSSVALVILVGLILWCAYAGSHTSQVTEERAPRRVGGDPDLESGLPRGSA